jgi:hypothetical protein
MSNELAGWDASILEPEETYYCWVGYTIVMKIQKNKGVVGSHKNVLFVFEYYTYSFKINMRVSPSCMYWTRLSQRSCGLMRGSTAVSLLRVRVRIPPGVWISVPCECFVLSGRGPCDGPIIRPENSQRMWCVWVKLWSLDYEALAH